MITEVKIWSWFFQHSWKSANLNIVQHLAQTFFFSEVSWYFLHWEVFPTWMVTAAVGKTFIWATSRERTPPLIACIASQLVALPPSLRHQQMRGSGLGGDSPTNNYPVSDFTLIQKLWFQANWARTIGPRTADSWAISEETDFSLWFHTHTKAAN